MSFAKVGRVEDLGSGSGLCAKLGGEEVAVFLAEGSVYAVGGVCPHRDGPLAEGHVEGTTLVCPYHFARFDLKTGEVLEGPATSGVKCYVARIAGSDVEVGVP